MNVTTFGDDQGTTFCETVSGGAGAVSADFVTYNPEPCLLSNPSFATSVYRAA